MIVLALTGQAAQAQERDEDECHRLRPGITSPVEMASCTFDLAASERALDKVLTELRGRVPAERGPLLDETQRAWTKYRDEQCRWQAGGAAGNTTNSSDIIGCTADMNRKRANYLREDMKRWSLH